MRWPHGLPWTTAGLGCARTAGAAGAGGWAVSAARLAPSTRRWTTPAAVPSSATTSSAGRSSPGTQGSGSGAGLPGLQGGCCSITAPAGQSHHARAQRSPSSPAGARPAACLPLAAAQPEGMLEGWAWAGAACSAGRSVHGRAHPQPAAAPPAGPQWRRAGRGGGPRGWRPAAGPAARWPGAGSASLQTAHSSGVTAVRALSPGDGRPGAGHTADWQPHQSPVLQRAVQVLSLPATHWLPVLQPLCTMPRAASVNKEHDAALVLSHGTAL